MDNQKLATAIVMKSNIDNMESWIYEATKVHKLRLTMKVPKLILRTVPYGVYGELTFECDDILRNKILAVVKDHQCELEKKYKEL
jgi:hypothetical protein